MRRLALLAVAATLLAACASDDTTSADTTSADTTSASAPSTSAAEPTTSPAAGSLDWTSCPDAGEGFECATLTVPVDYDDPTGATIDLALIRLPAGNTSTRIGTLLVNPGGPGAPGTELVAAAKSVWPKRIRDRFDIVSWDPRGTGGSAPVDCVADLDHYFSEPDPSPDTPAENQVLVDRAQDFDDACEKADGPMLAHISTMDTTRDMDRVREALGEQTISYMGFSYGSELGAIYATLFPEHIRAMVLDGAIDPDLDGIETARAQAIGAEHALDAFLADCSAHRTCSFNNRGDAEGAFDTLMAQLDTDPLPPPDEGQARGRSRSRLQWRHRRPLQPGPLAVARGRPERRTARERRRSARAQRLVSRAKRQRHVQQHDRGVHRDQLPRRSCAAGPRCVRGPL